MLPLHYPIAWKPEESNLFYCRQQDRPLGEDSILTLRWGLAPLICSVRRKLAPVGGCRLLERTSASSPRSGGFGRLGNRTPYVLSLIHI